MKKAFVLVFVSFLASQSFGATVKSAKLDASKKNILIDVVYGGGCGKHDFSLEVGLCFESSPVSCTAELIHKTDDTCEALIGDTIVISLKKAGLTGSYYEGASLTITGDLDWETNKPSKVTVKLP
ncbi:MAG: hypothetical protein HC883_02295 [Bdellovibrionaceae bacterium]|nr:hypothetical protein [Pseudobdellovibrionaceae bacterium]